MDKKLILLGSLFLIPLVMAAVPQSINIHAKLTDPSGAALVGEFDVSFRIYDAATGGVALYSDSQDITTDANGIFTTILPDMDAVDFDQDTWLALLIEGETLEPRINITSVPSALAGSGGLWTEGISNMIYYNAGNVGIGTDSPGGKLELDTTAAESTKLIIDNNGGVEDAMLQFLNGGSVAWSIGYDDSFSDELEFVRLGDMSNSDTVALNSEGMAFGVGRMYFDRSTTWTTSVVSSRYNNAFTVRNLIATNINSILHPVNSQPIWIICNDANTVFIDQGIGGNLQLASNFNCGVGDSLHLMYSDAIREWIEISRSNN